jgi:hypothetical protein
MAEYMNMDLYELFQCNGMELRGRVGNMCNFERKYGCPNTLRVEVEQTFAHRNEKEDKRC